MALGGRICPHCRKYTANDEARCLHCQRYLGPPWLGGLFAIFANNPIWATSALASLSCAVFFGEVILAMANERPEFSSLLWGFGIGNEVLWRFGAVPSMAEWGDGWRLVCACYIHVNTLHLVANMIALFDYGRIVEPKIKGPRMIIGYTVTGVVGFATSAVWYQWFYAGQRFLTAGASGAVFGIQGLVLGQMLASKDARFQSFLFRTIAYSVIFYYMMGGIINQAAHMGGLASGIALGFLFGRERRPWHRDKYLWAAAALCALLTLGFLAFAQWQYLHVPLE